MITLAGIVVALCAWFAGLGLLELAELVRGPVRRRRNLFERHGLALLIGLATLPTLYSIVAILFVDGAIPAGVGRWLAWAPGGAGLALYAWGVARRWRAGEVVGDLKLARDMLRREAGTPARAWSAGILALAIVFFSAFALFYSSSLPMHLFDSLYHFAYKGKVIFQEGFRGSGFMVPSPELELGSGVGRLMTHPNYPPGVGALHCLVASQLGAFSEDATRALMALYAVGSAAVLLAWTLRRSLFAALVTTLTWISLPFLYYSKTWFEFVDWPVEKGGEARFLSDWSIHPEAFTKALVASWIGQRSAYTKGASMPDGWMLDGAADLQQGVLFCLGAILAWRCLARARESWDRADAIAAALLLSGATYVKNEGLALVAVTAVVLGGTWLLDTVLRRADAGARLAARRSFGALAFAFGATALAILPWLAIRGEIPSVDEDYPAAIKIVLGLEEPPPTISVDQPQNVDEALTRVPIVFMGFVLPFVNVLRWNLVWVLFFTALATWLVMRPVRLWRHPVLPLATIAVGTLTAYGVILIVTPWDLAILYSTAIPDRLLLHVVPLVLFVSAALVWRFPSEWFGEGRRAVAARDSGAAAAPPPPATE